MAEDGANLFESGTLAQHLCGSGMSKYVRAAKWRLHAGPGNGTLYDRGHGRNLE
jgi:hypothetical protein